MMPRCFHILLPVFLATHVSLAADAVPATRDAGAATQNAVAQQNWFGVAVENIPPQISRQLKLRREQGLMVLAVLPDSPAKKAGLRADDILIEIDDAPLSSQEDLARAANALEQSPAGLVPKISRITYLRDGDRATIDLTPAPRPANMIALGSALQNFTAQATTETQISPSRMFRNYAFSNGEAAQIGPGYRMKLSANDPSTLTTKSIQSIVSKGQTIILTQETDLSGTVKNTLTVGPTTYVVESGHLDSLPPDLRPLGEQLLLSTPAPATSIAAELEQRVKTLEVENQQLQEKLSQLIDLMQKEHAGK